MARKSGVRAKYRDAKGNRKWCVRSAAESFRETCCSMPRRVWFAVRFA